MKNLIKKLSFFKNVFIKFFLKKENLYQNIYTFLNINDYHSGNFNKFHNKFSKQDRHLNYDFNITRFRNYINFKISELSLKNNSIGSFLSVGISYGTSLKVITHLLDNKVKKINYYLIDNYQNIGNLNYNTDINNVKKDLKKIKNFNFVFFNELASSKTLKKIKSDLIFSHLNTGNFNVEFRILPEIIKKTKNNGVILIDNYGFWKKENQIKIDKFIKKNKLFKFVFPSLQLLIIKN